MKNMKSLILLLEICLFLIIVTTLATSQPVDFEGKISQNDFEWKIYKRTPQNEDDINEEYVNVTTKIVNDNIKENNNQSVIAEKLANTDNAAASIIANTQNIFGSIISIAANLFDIKAEATIRGVNAAGKTAEAIKNSETAAKLLEAGETIAEITVEGTKVLGEAAVEGSRRIGETVSKAGAAAAPIAIRTAEATAEGAQRVTRLTICALVCPLRKKEEDKKDCQKENCGKLDKSDNLDYYDGDYTGFERQYTWF